MSCSEGSISHHPLIRKICLVSNQYAMIQKGDRILIAVSGGPDSVALLHFFLAVSDIMALKLGIAHLNHCIRQTAADHDAQFVKLMAKKYHLPFFLKKKDILREQQIKGGSLEEIGRQARYQFFDTLCDEKNFNKIALGHHSDDNAEQILLNLLRGSGPAGISGIPPARDRIIRPLIQSSRNEILDYLHSCKIAYVLDQSNVDERFFRNRIRHSFMPLLKSRFNPKISDTLNRLGDILRCEEEWITETVQGTFEHIVVKADDRHVSLSIPELLKVHKALQRRLIRKSILEIKKDLRKISYSHIDDIIHLICKKTSDARIDLPDQIRAVKHADHLIIRKESKNLRRLGTGAFQMMPPTFEYSVFPPDIDVRRQLVLPEINARMLFQKLHFSRITGDVRTQTDTGFFDWETIGFPIIIRNKRPGDRFHPFGMPGPQKLKKFLVNAKTDPEKRFFLPIFLSGDSIIWIGGVRIADPYKITPSTQHVLRIDLIYEL